MNKANVTGPIRNGTISYRGGDIDFTSYQDVLLPISGFSRTLEQLDLDSTNILELSSDFLLVKVQKSKSENFRAKIDKLYKDSLEGKSRMNPKKIDGKYQILEILAGFYYGDYEYFVLNTTYPLTDETVPKKGIYKGVIIHPELYFSDKVGEQVEDGAHKTGKILTQGETR